MAGLFRKRNDRSIAAAIAYFLLPDCHPHRWSSTLFVTAHGSSAAVDRRSVEQSTCGGIAGC
jgi:hypothetical protein